MDWVYVGLRDVFGLGGSCTVGVFWKLDGILFVMCVRGWVWELVRNEGGGQGLLVVFWGK